MNKATGDAIYLARSDYRDLPRLISRFLRFSSSVTSLVTALTMVVACVKVKNIKKHARARRNACASNSLQCVKVGPAQTISEYSFGKHC